MKQNNNALKILYNKKILFIFAHYEDHLVFGWPMIQYSGFVKKYLFTATSELSDVVEKSCMQQEIVYMGNAGLSNKFGLPLKSYADSKSYYSVLKNKISEVVEMLKPDFVFTHNPMGEYGHLDHKLLFEVVYNEIKVPIITTDIVARSSYYHFYTKTPKYFDKFKSKLLFFSFPDYAQWEKSIKVFVDIGKFTKNKNLNIPVYPKGASVWLLA